LIAASKLCVDDALISVTLATAIGTPSVEDASNPCAVCYKPNGDVRVDDEVRELQALLDRTFARANPHLLKIVKPERRLNARQVVRIVGPGDAGVEEIEPSATWAYAFHPENSSE
jgi:hypothetical protein